MRIELSNTLPGRLNEGLEYLSEISHWPNWYSGLTAITGEPHSGRWNAPGDTVSFYYKVLGRLLEGTVVLTEIRRKELVRSVANVFGLPEVHQEYRFAEASEDSFVLTAILETEEQTRFRGQDVDRLLLPHALERDLKRTMENLTDIFAFGLPRPMWVL
jgi:hypothetical protein